MSDPISNNVTDIDRAYREICLRGRGHTRGRNRDGKNLSGRRNNTRRRGSLVNDGQKRASSVIKLTQFHYAMHPGCWNLSGKFTRSADRCANPVFLEYYSFPPPLPTPPLPPPPPFR